MEECDFDDKIVKFLKDLTELSREHGVVISGCGCCGSPTIYPMEAEESGGEYRWEIRSGKPDFEWEIEAERNACG